MRRQWSTLVVLAGSLVFLASLYLPWQAARCDQNGGGGLFHFLSSCQSIDPLPLGLGPAAVLAGLVLGALAVTVLVRPHLEDRLPIGTSALAMGYFAIALTQSTASQARRFEIFGDPLHTAFGAYLGVAAAALAALSAAVPRRRELFWDRSALSLLRLGLVAGFLATLVLPWQSASRKGATLTVLGIEGSAGILATGCVLILPLVWWKADPRSRVDGILLAATTVLLTGAIITIDVRGVPRTVAPWVAGGIAVALLASAAIGTRPATPRMSSRAVAAAASVSVFIASLFLPWQRECGTEISKAFSQRCVSENAWTTGTAGSIAAVLAVALAVALWAPGRLRVSALELALGFGLVVATAGFQLQSFTALGGYRLVVAYGSTVGFVGASALVALAVVGARPSTLDWRRLVERAIPLGISVAYIAVIVVPMWGILSGRVQSILFFPPFLWTTLFAETLIGVYLLGHWVRRAVGPTGDSDWLVVLPLFLLALAVLDVITLREAGITWRGGIVVGLCLLLAFFGLVERRGGLRNLRVPEILRLDRLSEP